MAIEPKMIATVGDAEMITNPVTEAERRANTDAVQYRINEQLVQRETYVAYVLTLIAGTMTNEMQQIGKPAA